MTKREIWRAKAARYLRWHRAANRSRAPRSWIESGMFFEWYQEAKTAADYWGRHGEQARAPSWYYPD